MKNISKLRIQPNKEAKSTGHSEPEQFHYYSRHFWDYPYQENLPLYPAGVENAIRKSPTWYRDYCCRHHIIVCAPQGEVFYKSPNHRFCLKRNRVLIIPQGQEFYFETSEQPFYQKVSLFILGINLSAVMETLELNRMEMVAVPDVEPFVEKILELEKRIADRNIRELPQLSGMTLELLYELAENKAQEDKDLVMSRIIKSRLTADFENPVRISTIADELRINVRTLNRIFQEKFNITPREYRLNCRLERAQDLLVRSDMSIKEIAQSLGYCNQFYFANEFKRMTGIAPRDFRSHNHTDRKQGKS